MSQWNRNKLIKKIAAFILCTSMMASMPIASLKVAATDVSSDVGVESTETKTEGTTNNFYISTGTEDVNVDANGQLGKNSDIGVEVTKSITGKAGKKVKMSFNILSTDEKNIKLKSVYPVIDSDFPFETSGDAYKVSLAGKEPKTEQKMQLEYTMTARGDLETGYHSVKYICEYTKLDKDLKEVSYYVIKTINIYFTGKTSSGDKKESSDSGSKNGSTTNNNSTNNSSTYNYYNSSDDDDDDDYDDDDDDTGSGSSSSNKRGSGDSGAPKLLITGFETKPEKIIAGQKFELTIHIKNTAKSTTVCNGKFLIGNEAGTFLPTSGSNAVFIEKIEPEKTGDLKIELKTSADMPQKTYALIVKGDFEDGKGNSYTSNDSLSVPLYQEVKLGIADVTMSPEAIGIGGEGSIMFTINNQGNANVNNVTVATADEAVTSEGCYVGNITGMGSAYATLPIVGAKDNTATGKIKITISYEDSEGNAGKIDQELDCLVGDGIESDYDIDEEMDEEYEDEEFDFSWKKIALIAGAVVLLIVIIVLIIVLRIRKKKKLAQLLEEDEFGEDDIENEDF